MVSMLRFKLMATTRQLLIVGLFSACSRSTDPVALGASAVHLPAEVEVPSVPDASDSDDELVRSIVAAGNREAGDVREVTRLYSWVSTGRVFRVLDRSQRRLMTVLLLGTKRQRLSGNVLETSEFMSSQFRGQSSGNDRRSDIAQFWKDVMIGPHAIIATEEFCSSQRRVIGAWLKGREKDPGAFMSFCSGIKGDEGGGTWTIRFNLFNTAGGVDAVVVTGKVEPFSVERFETSVLKPAGEFYYPLEG